MVRTKSDNYGNLEYHFIHDILQIEFNLKLLLFTCLLGYMYIFAVKPIKTNISTKTGIHELLNRGVGVDRKVGEGGDGANLRSALESREQSEEMDSNVGETVEVDWKVETSFRKGPESSGGWGNPN